MACSCSHLSNCCGAVDKYSPRIVLTVQEDLGSRAAGLEDSGRRVKLLAGCTPWHPGVMQACHRWLSDGVMEVSPWCPEGVHPRPLLPRVPQTAVLPARYGARWQYSSVTMIAGWCPPWYLTSTSVQRRR
jgi:hypothetical protein